MRVQNEQLAARLFTVEQRNSEMARDHAQSALAGSQQPTRPPVATTTATLSEPPPWTHEETLANWLPRRSRGGCSGACPKSPIPLPFTVQARENNALRAAAGSAVLHIPPAVPRVMRAVAAPPTPQTPAPPMPRGTPVSEVRRRALEARASAEELRRQNHQLQENLTSTPPPARASALARARGSSSASSSQCTPQLRDRDRQVTDGSGELIELAV